ncbi:MAG TPA: PQQ-binding-like beta-propeller repeat protein [Vicinamibacteria bacterium]
MTHARARLVLVAACGWWGLGPSLGAEDWPQWRGPRADGSSLERGLPTSWAGSQGQCWSTELPGQGHSSPIVSQGSVFVTTALGDGHERALVRVDAATGRIVWTQTVVKSDDLESLHLENSHVSSTPAADSRAVYTSFYASGKAHVAAVGHDGGVLWTATPIRYRSMHGYHHNPLLLGDLLVLSYDALAEAAVLALDPRTGRTRWRLPLPNDYPSNVAPFPVQADGRQLIVAVGNDRTRALDAASGSVVWQAAGPTQYCVAGPAAGAGILFVSGGYPDRRSLGFKIAARGEVVATDVAWESRKGTTYVPSPVFHEGTFYAVNDGGLATAWDARTGDVRWQERLSGRFRASMVLAEGRIYATNDAGVTTVFRASPARYEAVGSGDVGEFVYATPAFANGRIFIRTRSRLVALGCAPR